MNEVEIQKILNSMANRLMDMGLSRPDATLMMCSNASFHIGVKWDDGSTYGKYNSFNGSNLTEAFDKAHAYIDGLPSVEEIRKQEFLEAVARAVEAGKAANIDLEYIAPLMDTIKKLSENAITKR